MWFAAAAAALFSTGGLFIKRSHLAGVELSSARSLVAAATLIILSRFLRAPQTADPKAKNNQTIKITLLLVAAVFCYAATLLLFVQATKLTTAANAIFLQYTAPVYVLLLEPLLFKEKYRARDFLVVVVCLGGMSLFFQGAMSAGDVRGNLTALASGLAYALFTLLLRLRARYAPAANQLTPIIYGNLLLGLVAAPVLFHRLMLFHRLTPSGNDLTTADLWIVLFLGAIQIGLAYTLFSLCISRGARSLDLFIVGYIEPILNPLLVLLFIGEHPSWYALLGGTIIIAAVVAHGVYESRVRRRTNTVQD